MSERQGQNISYKLVEGVYHEGKRRTEEKRLIMKLHGAVVVEYEEGDDESVSDEEQLLNTRRTRIRETYQDVKISDKLSANRKRCREIGVSV